MGDRNGRAKVRKITGWDKHSLAGKGKDALKSIAHKQSKTRNSFTTSHQQAGVQPAPKKQGCSTHESYSGRQKPSSQKPPPSFFLPQLSMLSMMSYSMEYHFGQLGSAVPAASPPTFSCTPSPLAGGVEWEAEKTLALCKHCSFVIKTSLSAQIQNIASG